MILLHCEEQSRLGDLYQLGLARGLEEALRRAGGGTVVNATAETLRKLAAAGGVRGVVLATGADRWTLARELAARRVPCVVIAQHSFESVPGVGWVHLDLESGARELAASLLEMRHRRIGFIGNYEEDAVRHAFLAGLAERGNPLPDAYGVLAGAGREAGRTAMHQLLRLRQIPTAVFARTDLLASGALEAARDQGYRVPDDISVVGHDDIPIALTADLATVRIDCQELGAATADVLRAVMNDPDTPTEIPVVKTRLVSRGSLGPPN